ncbi:hypothetical protein [Blastococcus sp. TF02A-30]|uniref:hypothetical protein n=1 Tax=Blastococcus sp. TF02A-30 TaxID=2250580 RepID=UPI000DE919C6|nr:hypothetical protein [Blastococcus sp. TF02A-30]RBY91216.1 hypothetical protein DQ241_06015 [Blastococcus sp. TF02A-30]
MERVGQLLVRDVCGATSVDGSGGDGAQDLRQDGPDGLTIFEIKSFTRRLTSGQKRQIASSCQRAIELHQPRRWVLVIPLNHSPAELAWFDRLRAKFPDVALEWYGQDWLDGRIAGREDLISYVEGAQYKLLRRAKQHGMERAALTSGADLVARMDDLLELGATISPYWTWRSGDTPWGPANIFTAQRPEAPAEDPVQLTPLFSFPADDPEAQATFERLRQTLRVGGDVQIPGRFIDELRLTAASEATQRLLGEPTQQVAELRLVSIPNATGMPLHCSLVLERQDDQQGVSLPFTFTERVSGSHGTTLTGTDASGLLQGQLLFEDDGKRADGRFTMNLAPVAGSFPHDALPAVRLLGACAAGDTLRLRRGPVSLASFLAGAEMPDGLAGLLELVAALEVVQDHLGALIPIPAEPLSDEDAHDLLTLARALSGQRARLRYPGLDLAIRPGQVRSFLDAVTRTPGALYGVPDSGFTLTLDGHEHQVPGLAFWAPNVQLSNQAELESVAAAGGSEAVASFTSPDGLFVIRAVEDPGPQYQPVGEAVAGRRSVGPAGDQPRTASLSTG